MQSTTGPSNLHELRLAHNNQVTRLKNGEGTIQLHRAYSRTFCELLDAEFTNMGQVRDPESLKRWQNVNHVLRAEICPVSYEAALLSGCSHIYLATALSHYVRRVLAESPPSLFTTKVLSRLQGLLRTYLINSTLISSLRHHPDGQLPNYRAAIQALLQQEHLETLAKGNELLLPIAYVAPDTNKGHLMLCKVQSGNVMVFNSLPTVHDKPVAFVGDNNAKMYQLQTAFTIKKLATDELTLQHVYETLPLQFRDHMVTQVGEHPEAQKLHKIATEVIYQSLLQNGNPVKPQKPTVFSYVQYIEGDICVPMAFHMVLIALGNEAARIARLDAREQSRLREQCDAFWRDFKSCVSATTPSA